MYAISLFSELNELREQSSDKQTKVTYVSTGVSAIQLFVEFTFDLLGEQAMPIVVAFEGVKAISRWNEYRGMLNQDKVKVYLDFVSYKALLQQRDVIQSQLYLPRSQKVLLKPLEPALPLLPGDPSRPFPPRPA